MEPDTVTPPVTPPQTPTNEPPALEIPASTPTPTPAPQGLTKAEVDQMLSEAKAKWDADSKLSATELAQKQLDDDRKAVETARAEIKTEKAKANFETAATAANAKDSARLMKMYESELKISDTGAVENVSEILTKARTEFPEMFNQTPSIDASSGNQTPATLTREQIEKMSIDDIRKNMDAVLKSMALIK